MSLFGGNTGAQNILLGYQIQSSIYGLPIPIIYGQQRVAGNIIWSGNWVANPNYHPPGVKSGKSKTNVYGYTTGLQIALCQGPIRGIGNVWLNKAKLVISNSSESFTIPQGGGSVTPTNAGTQPFQDTGVTGIDGTIFTATVLTSIDPTIGQGQYVYSGSGVYTFSVFDQGKTVIINTTGQSFTIPMGGGSFSPKRTSTNFIADAGVSTVPRDYAVVANDFGSPGPVTMTGQQTSALTLVQGNPGPGQYSLDPSTGLYTFNEADAGLTVIIAYSWADPNYLTDGDPVTSLNMELFLGTQGQAPWSFLESSAALAPQALGYTGIAYLASPNLDLGTSGALSNYGFEVLGLLPFGGGIVDSSIADVIQHYLGDPLVGTGFPVKAIGDLSELRSYTIANDIFISDVCSQQRPASDQLADWVLIANCEAVWSNGVLKFRAYGDKTAVGNGVVFTPNTTPIYDLDDDDFVGDPEAALLSVTRPTVRDAYNSVTVEWTNRGNSYAAEPVEERDDWAIGLYGLRPAPTKQLHAIVTSSVAQLVANTQLQRSVYIRAQYKFKVSAVKYQLLEPMDMVTLTEPEMGLYKTPVRIKTITEDDDLTLELECEEFPWGTATPTEFPKQNIGPFGPLYFSNPGNTLPVLFYEPDPPAVIAGGVINTLYIGLAGAQNWGGCHVYVSTDGGNSYVHVGKQSGSSTVGYLSAVLPPVTDPDDTSTLAIDMSITQAQLLSYSVTQENNLVPLCVVDQELIAYRTATLTSTNQYALTHLRRAAYESPLSQHNSGAPFGFFDPGMFVWNFPQSVVNTTVYFKFLSFNKAGLLQQTLDKVIAYPYFIHGERPPYPWSTHDAVTPRAPNNLYRSPNFGLREKILTDVNGNVTPQFIIDGFGICNKFSKMTVAPQIVQVTVSSTGGTIAGNQVVVLGTWAQGSDNLMTRMALMSVEIPPGTNTNSIQFSVVFANPTDQGWIAITTNTNAGWYGPGAVATPTSAPASIQPQLQVLANQFIQNTGKAGLDIDQWLFYWSQITEATLSGGQVESLIIAAGLTDDTIISIGTFLAAVPLVVALATYQFTQIGELDTPVPDEQFDHYVVQGRTGYVLGANGGAVQSINYDTGEITFPGTGLPTGGQWVGRTATCYGLADPTSPLPIMDVVITAQSTSSITVDPASLRDANNPLSIPLSTDQLAQLTFLANQDGNPLDIDQWLFYWSQITGYTPSGSEVTAILIAAGLTVTTRSTTVSMAVFLAALPAGGALINAGDLVLIHLTATGFSAGRIEDSTLLFWQNTQPATNGPTVQGMTPNAYNGKLLFITRNTGAGQIVNITSNDGIGFNVSPQFTTVPDATSEFIVINSSIDYQNSTSSLAYTAMEGGANNSSTAALQSQLQTLERQYLINNPSQTGLDIDQWAVYYTQVTGIALSPGDIETILTSAGLTDATRSTVIPVTTFLNALPGEGTPVELTLIVDNSWRHFFIQVKTGNNEDVNSLDPYSPYRLIFQPGFAGPNNFGTPQDTFYIGFLPGGLPGPIPAGGTSTLSVERIPGTLYAWDAVAEINTGAAATVFDVQRTRTDASGNTTTVSIFDDPSQYITIPGNSTLIASGTAFSLTNADILVNDILQLVVISVDGSAPAQRATVNLFWKNNPVQGAVAQ